MDFSRAIHLPSGLTVRLNASALAHPSAAPLPTAHPSAANASALARLSGLPATPESAPFLAALTFLRSEGLLTDTRGNAVDVDTLPLRDVHTLRALLTLAGHFPEEPAHFTCQNCDAPFEVAPSTLLEPAPFFDGELTDPEFDEPFPFDKPQPIARIALPLPRSTRYPKRAQRTGTAPSGRRALGVHAYRTGHPTSNLGQARGARFGTTITFEQRTAREALPLFNAVDAWISGKSKTMRMTPALVVAMGIVALGAEKSPRVIAEALTFANEKAWTTVIEHFLHAAYSPRLFGLYRCAECGARNDLDVPLAREWERGELMPRTQAGRGAKAAAGHPTFPDLDTFEKRVRHHGDLVYKARGVRNIYLIVDTDVPAVDDGGEPLLGSYVPFGIDDTTGIQNSPEVRLYYRTFQSAYEEDPTFDVEAEIHETIDHEIEHHLNFLGGDDPLDDEEQAAIDNEEVRRIGSSEVVRRNTKAFTGDLVGFFKLTWPLWLGVTLFALLAWYMS